MLYADKNALRTRLKVSLLVIRQQELVFYTNNCISIGTNALLLASFAWWGLTEPPFDELGNDAVQTGYLVITAVMMAFQLLAAINSTLSALLGPALAIRGPDGAMHTAVDAMITHYRFTYVCFAGGILFLQLSATGFLWMLFTADIAVPATASIGIGAIITWTSAWRVYRLFRPQDGEMVSGEFSGAPEEIADSMALPAEKLRRGAPPAQPAAAAGAPAQAPFGPRR
ncbi:hypothetical protein KFE25_001299 [Diacronema lutheri]|uniref:Uncharacterized protein n=2 Tax=Diacronema lutheri TaxID=2081491 RepID=A0A8J5X5R7_DIALT|nr:hypothetical protein KFE25_001299 [Diacronema lutheri]